MAPAGLLANKYCMRAFKGQRDLGRQVQEALPVEAAAVRQLEIIRNGLASSPESSGSISMARGSWQALQAAMMESARHGIACRLQERLSTGKLFRQASTSIAWRTLVYRFLSSRQQCSLELVHMGGSKELSAPSLRSSYRLLMLVLSA